ncbi:MAG: hypothetical protein GY852_08585, partial [bacterium]|nr:hypothetical protein [bacterium]
MQLEELKGERFRDEVMKGSAELSSSTAPGNVISWTADMMVKLKTELSGDELHDVVTGCACHYPAAKLVPIRDAFRKNGSLTEAIDLLKKQFVESLQDGMLMESEIVDELLRRNMGVAGTLEGNCIIATKIPKSGLLRKWLKEKDPEERRKIYCHCPRVNQAV